MKLASYFTILMFVITANLQAQTMPVPRFMSPGINQPGTNLQQVTNYIQSSTIAIIDTGEGCYLDRLGEFQRFWQNRVFANDSTANDSTNNNMFTQYFHAIRHCIADRMIAGCGTDGFHGNWQCLGPNTLQYQAVGKVDVVWAAPTDNNYILAGTAGGFFKTTDGGANWANL